MISEENMSQFTRSVIPRVMLRSDMRDSTVVSFKFSKDRPDLNNMRHIGSFVLIPNFVTVSTVLWS